MPPRLVLYAGPRQGDAIVASGPLVAVTQADIRRLLVEHRERHFVRMRELVLEAG